MEKRNKCVNILYQCDDKYAPFMGISLTSLLMNNQSIEQLKIFVLASNISEENKKKISDTCRKYNREIMFLECGYLDERLQEIGVQKCRNSYTTFYKLFIGDFFSQKGISLDRLLYIDSDTIIEGDIEPFYFSNLKGKPLGMIPDTFAYRYKPGLGFDSDEMYYNAGIILYDYKTICEDEWEEKMRQHMTEVKSDYEKHDQDLINVVYRNYIEPIPLRYNMLQYARQYRLRLTAKYIRKLRIFQKKN